MHKKYFRYRLIFSFASSLVLFANSMGWCGQAGLLKKLVPPRILSVSIEPLKLDSATPEIWARQKTAEGREEAHVNPGIRFFNDFESRMFSMIPRNKLCSRLSFTFLKKLTLNVFGNLVDEQFFADSRSHSLIRSSGYLTMDMTLTYPIKNWGASLSMNNVLDKKYSLHADTEAKPSTGRAFILRFSHRF